MPDQTPSLDEIRAVRDAARRPPTDDSLHAAMDALDRQILVERRALLYIDVLLSRVEADERRIKALEAALKEIRDDFDHEEQTRDHQPFRYGGTCRVCLAERTLATSTPSTEERAE